MCVMAGKKNQSMPATRTVSSSTPKKRGSKRGSDSGSGSGGVNSPFEASAAFKFFD